MTRLIELPAKNLVRLLELLDVVLEVFARVELDFSSFVWHSSPLLGNS